MRGCPLAAKILYNAQIIEDIVKEVGTPVYVYDGDLLRKHAGQLANTFVDFNPHYSLKANPCPAICRAISDNGFGAEVSSDFEAMTALQAGYGSKHIMYDGPAKSDDEILSALSIGISHFNFESTTELKKILDAAEKSSLTDELILCARINPKRITSACEVMTGGSSRFGIDEEKIAPRLRQIKQLKVGINGVHLYVGSQILDINEIIGNFRAGLQALLNLSGQGVLSENTPEYYVFGAGIGVPYSNEEQCLDIQLLAEGLKLAILDHSGDFKQLKVKMEIGRALVATSAMYVVRVIETKISRGQRYIIVNGGIHQFMRYALTGTNHRIQVFGKSCGDKSKALIAGATCTPYDVLAECEIGKVENGDLLCIMDAGAYGWSMGLSFFLSHPTPPEVVVENGDWKVVRRRSNFGDFQSTCLD